MRENRTSGSEGGGAEANRLSLPLSKDGSEFVPWTILRDAPIAREDGRKRPDGALLVVCSSGE